ncbi:MAG: hypothetical protein P4L82_07320 [Ancalomicrobiaceae bacterium]|nr:hypothetical protein [Ancalomicrobiaceae bacterium]
MDPISIAVTLMSARSQSTTASIAAQLIHDDLGAEKQLVQLLTASSDQIGGAATAAAGLGQTLDISV